MHCRCFQNVKARDVRWGGNCSAEADYDENKNSIFFDMSLTHRNLKYEVAKR